MYIATKVLKRLLAIRIHKVRAVGQREVMVPTIFCRSKGAECHYGRQQD